MNYCYVAFGFGVIVLGLVIRKMVINRKCETDYERAGYG